MDPNSLIDAFGGPGAVARLLGIRQPSVSEWRHRGIPVDKKIRLACIAEQRGIATRRELFPEDFHEIWPELAE